MRSSVTCWYVTITSRKMVKKMKRKGNTSVPYGSGYKKVNEAQKTVTNKSFDKKKTIGHMKKKGKSVFHVRDEKTKKRFDVRLIEQKEIKKVIGIFGGRFQPFHIVDTIYIQLVKDAGR